MIKFWVLYVEVVWLFFGSYILNKLFLVIKKLFIEINISIFLEDDFKFFYVMNVIMIREVFNNERFVDIVVRILLIGELVLVLKDVLVKVGDFGDIFVLRFFIRGFCGV